MLKNGNYALHLQIIKNGQRDVYVGVLLILKQLPLRQLILYCPSAENAFE